MVKKCCIFNCNRNYNEENKERVFRLPTKETECNKWIAAIPRDNIPDSKDMVACERHWPQIIVCGKSRPSTSPSVFCCVPPSLLPPLYHPRKTKLVVQLKMKYLMKC